MKKQIADKIRNFGFWVHDWTWNLGEKISPFDDGSTEIDRMQQMERLHATIDSRLDGRCPACNGKGSIVVSEGTDVLRCSTCKGTGLDLPRLVAQK